MMMDGGVSGMVMGMNGLAYMNPGTGSFILQMLLMGLAGGVLTARSAWNRLQHMFKRKKPE